METTGRLVLLLWVAMLLWLPYASAWAQKKAIGEDVTIVDDFEDGDLLSTKAGLWLAMTDKDEGGSSTGQVSLIEPGYGSSKAILYEYELGKNYLHKDSKEAKPPFTFLGLTMSPKIWQPCDISPYRGICFHVKGVGQYTVLAITNNQGKVAFFSSTFSSDTNEWKKVTIEFTKLQQVGTVIPHFRVGLDTRNVIVFGISHSNPLTAGYGEFLVDNFAFLGKTSVPDSVAQEVPEEIRFGNLLFSKPNSNWTWEPGKETSQLTWKLKATTMAFIGIPIIHSHRIPFSDGLTADPGNLKELAACTLYEIGKLGFRKLQAGEHGKIQLKNFQTARLIFSAEYGPEAWQQIKILGIQNNRAFLQVDFIRHRSITYEIVTCMPLDLTKTLLAQTNKIIYNLDKQQR